MIRSQVLRAMLLVHVTGAVVLLVLTVVGIVTGRGLSPLVTGAAALSAGLAALAAEAGGGWR